MTLAETRAATASPVCVPTTLPFKPFRQGKLDHLCGLYALINGLRRARHGHYAVNEAADQEVFKTMVEALDGHCRPSELLCQCLSAAAFEICLQALQASLLAEQGLHLTAIWPLRDRQMMDIAEIADLVRAHLARYGTSAVLQFMTPSHIHWTVIDVVTYDRLIFADSAWFTSQPIADCQSGDAWELREGHLSFEELLLLEVAPVRDQPARS